MCFKTFLMELKLYTTYKLNKKSEDILIILKALCKKYLNCIRPTKYHVLF